jgi:hypothetical protein
LLWIPDVPDGLTHAVTMFLMLRKAVLTELTFGELEFHALTARPPATESEELSKKRRHEWKVVHTLWKCCEYFGQVVCAHGIAAKMGRHTTWSANLALERWVTEETVLEPPLRCESTTFSERGDLNSCSALSNCSLQLF